ncbi:MAG: sulfite exporter TauE/SafE family protein [Halocynthiibacter sp.]
MFELQLMAWVLAVAITLFASFVKGVTGFAMPLIMMSLMGAFLPYETVLAMLIVPTVATNMAQSLRQGPAAMWETMKDYKIALVVFAITVMVSAQFVNIIPKPILWGILGAAITLFCITQLLGIPLKIEAHNRTIPEIILGIVAGFFGGISGIWGPPIVAMTLSLHLEKKEAGRVQGVVFFVGAVFLILAHLRSGILNVSTVQMSALMTIPAFIGMMVGFRVQDKLSPAKFRKVTMVILLLAGLNLLRRAVFAF